MTDVVETKEDARTESVADRYNRLVLDAELCDYAPVRGCIVIREYGMAIWEQIQSALDKKIKDTGCGNSYFPLLIPQSLIAEEKEHIEGFAPECAVVTHGGGEQLAEPLIVRPTSETIISKMFAKWVRSWRDLPMQVNQWCNVVRWEKRTRPFLRTREFLWQEGHTLHATSKEAEEKTKEMLEIYRQLAEDWLALPVLVGKKTERERFAGAVDTYCIEAMMQDGKALQAGTSHFLGQNFAKGIQFQSKEGKLESPWQTSWGVSTRLIGALVLAHMDEKGLMLPPKLAPHQVVIVPIYKTDEERELVLAKAREIKTMLADVARVHIDARDHYKPGFKFAHWEQKGVPVRINIGPRDVANDVVEVVRRDDVKNKTQMATASLATGVASLLDSIHKSMFARALKFREENTVRVSTYDEFKQALAGKNVFIECFFAGSSDDEARIKEETKATVRCIPFTNAQAQDGTEGKCVYTGKNTTQKVVFARAH